jgi:predicted molibdopterin-dependent oxidoreductase YjgC
LAPTFGRGAITNTWQDIKNANVVLVMGGNAAQAHPCGFKWVTEAKQHNHGKMRYLLEDAIQRDYVLALHQRRLVMAASPQVAARVGAAASVMKLEPHDAGLAAPRRR